ncbi:hypothetical protein LINPERPRIM_LOCUS28489 [Linum perenne]
MNITNPAAKLMRFRFKDWISCFKTSPIPLDDDHDPNPRNRRRTKQEIRRPEQTITTAAAAVTATTGKLDDAYNSKKNSKSGEGSTSSIRNRRNRRNSISPSDDSTEEKKDVDVVVDDEEEYIEFRFRRDGAFEVEEEEKAGDSGSDCKRSDDGRSSDGSFSFPVMLWWEMVGSPVQMPKPEEFDQTPKAEEFDQIGKQRRKRVGFRQCCRGFEEK